MCATEGNAGRPFLTPPPISWPEEFQASSAGGAGAGSGIAAVVMDSRFRTVVRQVAKAFNLPTNEVEEAMFTEAHVGLINDFLGIAGPVRLVVGLLVPEGANQSGAEGLFMTAGDDVRITGKSVLVVRLSEAELTTSNMDSEVMVGVIQGSPIKTLLATLQHVYMPALGQRTSDWAAKLSEESSTEFVGSVGKFVEMLDEAVTSLESGLELAKPCAPHYTQPTQPTQPVPLAPSRPPALAPASSSTALELTHASRPTPHAPRLTPHASRLSLPTPHAPRLTPHLSRLTPHASYLAGSSSTTSRTSSPPLTERQASRSSWAASRGSSSHGAPGAPQ